MNTFRTLIADDQPLIRKGMELTLRADPEIEIVAVCSDGRMVVDRIRELHPALAFLDVQMPELDGFEILAELEVAERPHVVFVTAHEEHAVRAFEVSAVDFLVKPFTPARLAAATSKAKDAILSHRAGYLAKQVEQLLQFAKELEGRAPQDVHRKTVADSGGHLVLKVEGALHFLRPDDVLWVEAQGDFVKVQTVEKPQLVRDTLQNLEQKLDATKFLRIHRSFLVNLDHVSRVETALYGDYSVYMSDGTKLRLSRNYRSKLKALVAGAPVS